jgi:hypothetical protein
MTDYSHLVSNFTAGLLSKKLNARTDFEKYNQGCRQLSNMYVMPQGGVAKRPGTRYIADAKQIDESPTVNFNWGSNRLIPFIYGEDEAYILEFGTGKLRFYYNQERVQSGGSPYELNTPYGGSDLLGNREAEVFELQYLQTADVMYLFHHNYAPYQLTRTSHTSWTLAAVTFAPSIGTPGSVTATPSSAGTTSYNYKVSARTVEGYEGLSSSNANALSVFTLTPGGASVSVSWAAVAGAYDYYVYKKTNRANGVYGYLGKTNTTTFVDDGQFTPNPDITPQINNNSIFSVAGTFPRTGCFFESRLVLAGADNSPQTIYTSKTGEYTNFNYSDSYRADDAITLTLNAETVNIIRWIIAEDALIIGTSMNEWYLRGSGGNPLAPDSFEAKQIGEKGTASVVPTKAGGIPLFLTKHGISVHEFVYSLEEDGWRTPDLSILSTDMYKGAKIVEWAFQKHPDQILWCVLDDGRVLGFTYQREHKIYAWHEHDFSGYAVSVAVIPGSDRDEVWFCIVRYIAGRLGLFEGVMGYIELLENAFDKRKNKTDDPGWYSYFFPLTQEDTTSVNAFFVDSGASYDDPWGGFISYTNPLNISSTSGHAHGLTTGDKIFIRKSKWTELNNNTYDVTVVDTTNFTVDVDGTSLSADVNPVVYDLLWYKQVSSLSGLDHLEGEMVKVLGDGAVQEDQVVSKGGITLQYPASIVHVGLPYDTVVEPMLIDVPSQVGTSQSRLKRISTMALRFYETLGCSVGGSEEVYETIPFRKPSDPLGHPPTLFTGDKLIHFPDGYDEECRIIVKQTDPLPMTLTGLIPRLEVEGD